MDELYLRVDNKNDIRVYTKKALISNANFEAIGTYSSNIKEAINNLNKLGFEIRKAKVFEL